MRDDIHMLLGKLIILQVPAATTHSLVGLIFFAQALPFLRAALTGIAQKIIRGTNGEFGLKPGDFALRREATGFDQLCHPLVAQRSLQVKDGIRCALKRPAASRLRPAALDPLLRLLK